MNKVIISLLNNNHLKLLEDFCNESKLVGYQNNSSIENMKFGNRYDLDEIPKFWAGFYNNKIISVSGSHKWIGSNNDISIRCLFRSATLPEYSGLISGLSKNHMNSLPFSMILPYQIVDGLKQGISEFYITTSSQGHDASGKMKRTHRSLQLLAKNKIVEKVSDEIVYYTIQSKWKVNLDNYLKILRVFYESKKNSNLFFDDLFIEIIEQGFDRFINSSEIKR
jgi:hypothetical protein